MSDQQVEKYEEKRVTKEQILAVLGTLGASGVLDFVTHGNIPVMLGGAVAVFAAGKLTPEIMKLLIPGSDPDATAATTNSIINQLAPAQDNSDLPQDALSKLKRLAGIKSSDPAGRPKDEPVRPDVPPSSKKSAAPGASPLALAIPAQFKLESVLETIYALNAKGLVYFGRGGVDDVVALDMTNMYHILDVSASGKGKSNRFRLGMMQLVNTCEVYYVNPLANRVKPVSDSRKVEVWAPIFDRLREPPAKSAEEISALLAALAEEIKDRDRRESAGDYGWQAEPIFVFVDELPEIFARCPDAVKMLDKVGRMGRQYSVFAWVASQTAQVSEMGQSTAAQAQYKTKIYGGADATSSTRMGDLTADDKTTLKKANAGLVVMLAEELSEKQFVRAPLITNEALFEYFDEPFNLEDWLPDASSTTTRRRSILDRPQTQAPETTIAMQPIVQPVRPVRQEAPVPAQPALLKEEQVSRTNNAAQLERITRLFESDKIDLETFIRLLNAMDITDEDVSHSKMTEEVETEPLRLMPQKPALSAELQNALAAYQEGYNTARPLGERLVIGKTKAAELINELETLGLIEKRKRV